MALDIISHNEEEKYIKRLLWRFLKNENIYIKFLKNVAEYNFSHPYEAKRRLDKNSYRDAISTAFLWSSTKEGMTDWYNISKKWVQYSIKYLENDY